MSYSASLLGASENGAGHLILTLDNNTTFDAGYNTGATGATGAAGAAGTSGVGVSSAVVDASGHLIVTKTDGTTVNAGAVPGAGGLPILSIAFTTALTSYSLKAADLVGSMLLVYLDASAASGTFVPDAALLYGGSTTPATTKMVIVTRVDTTAANTVTIAAASGETIDSLASVSETVSASRNLVARSATQLQII